MRKTIPLAAAALALIASPLAAAAPSATAKPAATGKATPGQAPKMTPQQLANFQRAVRIMRLFTEAFKSDKVSNEVKGRLIACFYANDLAKISTATGQSAQKNGLDEKKPAELYRAAAGVCGITFKKVEANEAAKGDTGAKAPAKPASSGNTGR